MTTALETADALLSQLDDEQGDARGGVQADRDQIEKQLRRVEARIRKLALPTARETATKIEEGNVV